jgi:hypothetical protein
LYAGDSLFFYASWTQIVTMWNSLAFADSQGVASSTSFYLILVVGFVVEIRKKSSSRV